MTQPSNRRSIRIEDAGSDSVSDRGQLQTLPKGRKRGLTQPTDGFASSMHQPHFALNLFSIVFFCAGCLMLLMSTHQRVIKLIMSDCQSRTTITETRNSLLATSSFVHGKEEKEDMMMKNEAMERETKKEIRLQSADYPMRTNSDESSRKIEFVVAGNYAPFPDALDLAFPYSPPEDVNYEVVEQQELIQKVEGESFESGVKFFIGVTSACCNKKSHLSRNEIRKTWMQKALSHGDTIDVKFFLSQPSEDLKMMATDYIQQELEMYDDMVLVRGLDEYDNLPNKTFGMLKYALSSPRKYTHFLKTDDDSYVRVHKLLESLEGPKGTKMDEVYKGCLENRAGFYPIRDPTSKWYLKYDEFDDYMAQPIRGTKYLAGWGYVLSRDVMFHAMKKVYEWDNNPNSAPAWYARMKWEDVMMGILVSDLIAFPDADFRFKAAWRACTNETAIRHLDLDAPVLFQGLYAQDVSGLWDKKTVQCSSGSYVAGDYGGWKRWRNSAIGKELRI